MNAALVLVLHAAVFASRQQGDPVRSQVPVRTVTPPSATSTEPLRSVNGLKQLPDGRVLVNDPQGHRLLVFDQSLTRFSVSADSNHAGAPNYPDSPIGGLYDYLGDSALLVDMESQAFIVIEPNGKLGRAMAHPKPIEMMNIGLPNNGSSGIDARGRFVYRSANRPRPVPSTASSGSQTIATPVVDTIFLVRADFTTRLVDTIATVAIPRAIGMTATASVDGKPGGRLFINPFPAAPDDWAVLSDGSVAIIRAHDYHIDWIYADGTRASTPKMPFDWRRLTEQDKQARIDSMRHIIDSVNATGHPYGMATRRALDGNGGFRVDTIVPVIGFATLSEMPDYLPPIRGHSAKPDRDGNLWVLPSTSSQASGGLLYDVINRAGELFERVQLPAGRDIAGFGPHGVIYMTRRDATNAVFIERTQAGGPSPARK